jgi:hypothetical protein
MKETSRKKKYNKVLDFYIKHSKEDREIMIKSSFTVELSLLDAVTCASTRDGTTWGTTGGHRHVEVGEDPLAKEEE